VAYQLTLIPRRIEQRGDLGFAQLLSSHHSCLRGIPEAGRPADSGQEVEEGAAIGPKVRQTAALMAPLYLKRPATGHGKL
jgi:hypothetical protein